MDACNLRCFYLKFVKHYHLLLKSVEHFHWADTTYTPSYLISGTAVHVYEASLSKKLGLAW